MKANPAPAKMGRPSKFTEAIANEICERLAAGESLREICANGATKDFPGRQTILDWLETNEAFRAKYARARIHQGDTMDDRILQVADKTERGEIDPQAAKVVIGALQWRASKLRPDVYGDRTTLAGDPNAPLAPPTINVNFLGPKE